MKHFQGIRYDFFKIYICVFWIKEIDIDYKDKNIFSFQDKQVKRLQMTLKNSETKIQDLKYQQQKFDDFNWGDSDQYIK